MLEFEELGREIEALEKKSASLAEAISYDTLKSKIAELEKQSADENFWSDLAGSQKVLQKIAQLKNKTTKYESLLRELEDCKVLIELGEESEDASLIPETKDAISSIVKDLDQQSLAALLSGEYDDKNAILTFHAGAGGTEAMDWALMLYRMYTRWAEAHKFKVVLLDMLDGEEAGIKSASILIQGFNAYGYLHGEMGVHRLVRISPFDSSGRRHTSFASLEVMPEINDDVEITIKDEDLRVDTYRASGAGGQHINKTDSAIRITHLPTGIVVSCQNERSQHQNKDMAMKMLKSKLIQIKEREHLDKIEDIKGEQREIAWGSQIRSYVFMPYTLVKDHRTGFEVGNVNAVMDGDLDGFIDAFLKQRSADNLESEEN